MRFLIFFNLLTEVPTLRSQTSCASPRASSAGSTAREARSRPCRSISTTATSARLAFASARLAYTPDLKRIPEASLPFLEGLDMWIIDALRDRPHPTHFSLDDALSWIETMRPRRAILTNLHTDLDYETLRARLPAHVTPAYDGMRVEGFDG